MQHIGYEQKPFEGSKRRWIDVSANVVLAAAPSRGLNVSRITKTFLFGFGSEKDLA